MERNPLNSRAIASVGYDPDQSILEVEFRTGSVYHYYKVAPEVYEWFMRVRSKTAYLDRMIKGEYNYRRIDGDADPVQDESALLELLKASVEETEE